MMQLILHKKLCAADGMMEMNISCNIHNGKFVSLCGASGAGKTSILRMIAGFLRPDHGLVQFNDEVWFQSEKKIDLPPQQRKVGFVFQDYALFPNMTVKQNLQFALKKDEPQNYIDELMALTELEQLSKRNVLTLSGGQKQRVALARALVRKPGLLLLDEPLSAIDAELRYKLQDILIKIHRSYNLTTVLVSHDVTELARLSDEIFFIENGTIKKRGCPSEIFFSQLDHEDFAFKGSIAAIKKEDSAYFLYIVIGSQLIRHPVAETEIKEFSKGDKVILTSKAFRPFVKKIT